MRWRPAAEGEGMGAFTRVLLALSAPLMLTGCLLTPGKFASKLVLNADRSFIYSYVGEVYALDQSMPPSGAEDKPADTAKKKAEAETKNRAIADALSKEAGYRSVRYLGDGRFTIDYQVSGQLTH